MIYVSSQFKKQEILQFINNDYQILQDDQLTEDVFLKDTCCLQESN